VLALMRVAILDDYAGVATRLGDFASLPAEVTESVENIAAFLRGAPIRVIG
jgi:hypothetical protein